ncbi:tetratricopeptide repeat protein [Myxococcota bacterium]|nr:tetratricopeptide repeat protein [Myxococcota bacterium]
MIKERFLILHEDAEEAARICAALEVDILASFEPHHTLSQLAEAIKARPYDGALIHWGMPRGGAGLGGLAPALLIFELAPSPIPIFAFGQHLSDRDLARALQLGISGILTTPLEGALSRELEGVIGGVYPSIRALMARAGPRLYRPDPELWRITPDEALVARLARRAEAHLQAAPFYERVMRLIELLTRLDARAPTPKVLNALRRLIEGEGPQEVSAQTGLGVTRLRRLFRAVGQRGGGAAQLGALLDEATAQVQGRRYSADFKALRLAGAELILDLSDRFRVTLFEALKLNAAHIRYIDEGRLYLIASEIVSESDERTAMHIARFILLNEVLARITAFGLDKATFAALAALLGCGEDSDEAMMGLRAAACVLEEGSAYIGFKRLPLASINKLLAMIATKGIKTEINPIGLSKRLTQAVEIALRDDGVSRFRLAAIIDRIESGDVVDLPTPTREAIIHNLGLTASLRGHDTNLLWQSLGVLHKAQEARICDYLSQLDEQQPFSTRAFAALIKAAKEGEGFEGWRPPPSHRTDADMKERAAAIRVRLVEGFELDPELLSVLNFEAAARHPDAEGALLEACVTLMSARISEGQRALVLDQLLKLKGRDPRFLIGLQGRLGAADEGLRATLRVHLGLDADLTTLRVAERLLEQGQIAGAILALDEIANEDIRIVPLLNQLALALEADQPAEAVSYYERALSIQPKRLNLQLNLARSKVKLGDLEGARPLLIKIAQSSPGFGDSEALLKRVNQRA